MPYFGAFCRFVSSIYKSYILSADFAKYGKTLQFTPLIRSKIVVKIFGITTLDFAPPL